MTYPQIALITETSGVCLEGQWRGWSFRKHPDGQWVSEKRLDVADAAPPANSVLGQLISVSSPAPAVEPVGIKADDRLYNADEPMADGEIEMTAAENVLAWLIIEKIGVPDDRNYSPNEAREIVVHRLDYANELENESLRSALHPAPTPAGIGRIQSSLHPSFSRSGIEPCGGCGQSDPSKRCLGCLHSFPFTPTPVSAPVGESVEVHIVFQDDGGAANLRFVEVETLDRKSVCAGTWLKRDDGYDVLALSVHPSDIKTVEAK